MLRVVLVGYDKMLYSLIEGVKLTEHKIIGVFRNDRIKYYPLMLFLKDIFNPSKDFVNIKANKLYDIKARSVNSDKFISEIKKMKPDLIIVGSWSEKFKSEILSTATCINFHPALLPKNRGANPYFWTIYLNQNITGLTVHFMNEKFDRGDIILQEAITISENETGESLKDKTVRLAKVIVGEVLDLFEKKQVQPVKQDEKFASYEHQLTEKEIIIDLNKSKEEVSRHLRALYPWATPYVKFQNKYIPIKKYEFLDLNGNNSKNYEVVEIAFKYYVLKGSDFLIKIYY